MSDVELGLLVIGIASIGGAAGAKSGGQPAWKGLTIVLLSMLLADIVLRMVAAQNLLIGLFLAILFACIIGGAMKMSARQISVVLIGAIVILLPAGLVIAI
ncbi:hypothetical protein [Rhizobium sp. LC145]|uniref:hypothetical protein n=1 Tax=Rhizobium sp. LC145 TaxID=1120688 RepID=UPI000629F5E2|nr:hypothetical protein [Rhizobium sp. LC145]KKX24307.1 hypothetical protein YH62_27510 [Rhizobium sp. LC145]